MALVDHPAYLLLVAALAFAGTVTATLPVTVLLVAAILPAPRRWLVIVLAAVAGSASGATVLLTLFHTWGWAEIVARFPELGHSPAYATATAWIDQFGLSALAVIAATPMPQTPALFLCALGNYAPASVFVAVAVGKLAKYGCVGWLISRFPERFRRGARP